MNADKKSPISFIRVHPRKSASRIPPPCLHCFQELRGGDGFAEEAGHAGGVGGGGGVGAGGQGDAGGVVAAVAQQAREGQAVEAGQVQVQQQQVVAVAFQHGQGGEAVRG